MSAMEYSDYIDDEEAGEEVVPLLHLEFDLPIELRGLRIDKAIAQALPSYSRSKIQGWLESGLVFESARQVHPKDHASGTEHITIALPPDPQNTAYHAENLSLDIIYSDSDIAIINKPFGMVVHPAAGNWTGTLLNGLLHHFPECSDVPRAGIVHRLDKDTSGLLVIAKNLEAQHALVQQLQNRSMERKYLALAWGKTPMQKVIHAAVGRDPKDRLKMSILAKHGKEATTHLKTLHTAIFDEKFISLVSCILETGRTHQIRVHMESLGHALVNDPVYKNRIPYQTAAALKIELDNQGIHIPGQFLHAGLLGLVHPRTKESIRFDCPPSPAFLETLTYLKVPKSFWQDVFKT
jgi:23S rRNA pseudouridine1911/1915/1917 synthase